MHIVVCIKQVPDSAAVLKVDEAGKVSWGDAPLIVNPWDDYAVEEALLIKEKHGGKVTAITLGPEGAKDALKDPLAKGADAAILLSDAAFAKLDGAGRGHRAGRRHQKAGRRGPGAVRPVVH